MATPEEIELFERAALPKPLCDTVRTATAGCTNEAKFWATGHWEQEGVCYTIHYFVCGQCIAELKAMHCSKHCMNAFTSATKL